MTHQLIALLDAQQVGEVLRDRSGKLSFRYFEQWRTLQDAYPLSLSMPLASTEHGHARIDAFLWGLLPDNERILEAWAHKFHVSQRNAFGLIAAVGEDCAGAVQFVRPERLEATLGQETPKIIWLSEADIAQRLGSLRVDRAAWRAPTDTGQFSLAGAQPKTAFLYESGRWGVPSGRIPTTHIFKPPSGEFEGHAENEHFCLRLARSFELPAPNSEIKQFENEIAMVIERYDRVRTEDGLRRVHQEDICQALGLMPTRKYENEGGPGAGEVVELLRTYSADRNQDVATFVDSLALNWIIAGTDAHAKNYAVLIGAGGVVRLAPLYDLASTLPYKSIDPMRAKLAMKIGGAYRIRDIGIRQWQKLATELRLDEEQVVARIGAFVEAFPEHVSQIRKEMIAAGLTHPIINDLAQRFTDRSIQCRQLLQVASQQSSI